MIRTLRQRDRQRQSKQVRRSEGDELDHELALKISEGSREALELFVGRHLAPLYRYVVRRLGPGQEELAREVTWAAFDRAFDSLKPYVRGTARVPARIWLIRLANRQLARRQPRAAKRPLAQPATGESEGLTVLRRAMNALPPQQQAAVSLAVFERMPASEIAAALGTGQGRAMRILRRGLRRIGHRIEAIEERAS